MPNFPATDFRPRRSTNLLPYAATEATTVLAHANFTGLTLAAYAVRFGLDKRLLYWWRKKLRTAANSAANHRPAAPVSPTALAFVPVGAVRVPTVSAAPSETGVEVAIGALAIRLRSGFCTETLRRAVDALGGSGPC